MHSYGPKTDLLADALPLFERTLLQCALNYSNGHKQDAARLLGWGRNTLTRKLKEASGIDDTASTLETD